MNEEERELIPEIDDEQLRLDNKLIRKTKLKLFEITIATCIVMVLIAINQGKKLFLFDFISDFTSDDTIQSIFSGRIFGLIIYGTLLFVLIISILLSKTLSKRSKLSMEERNSSYQTFKKRYDFYDLIGVIPVFLAIIVVLNAFFFSPAIVHGPSMEPTFYENNAVIIYQIKSNLNPQDIIIYDRGDALLIKRLIAVAGDELVVNMTGVYLNGLKLDVQGDEVYYHNYNGIIPDGFCFIMGDNSAESNDSRYFGLVKTSDILGKVVFKLGNN
jgi:signal peptidase I